MYHYTSTMAKYVVLTVTHSLHLAATLSSQHLLWEQWNLCEIKPIEVTFRCNYFDLTLAWRPLRDAKGLLWWWRLNTQRVAFLGEGNYPFSACWVQKPNGFVVVLLGWTIFLTGQLQPQAFLGISDLGISLHHHQPWGLQEAIIWWYYR